MTDNPTLTRLIDQLRLVEREDGGSTRAPGSERAEALAAEIERRITETRKLLADSLGEDCLPVRILDGRA